MFPLKKPSPNHAFNAATSRAAAQAADAIEAQHRALTRMSNPTPPPAAGIPAVAGIPKVPGIAAMPATPGVPKMPAAPMAAAAAPSMPGSPAKGQYFPGLTAALAKPKLPM